VVLGSPDDLAVNGARIEDVSWVAGAAPKARLVEVQVRYRHAPVKARLRPVEGDAVDVRFEEPVRAVAPGQAAVFYDGDEVLGGGTLTAART
jgi:tRNA-specific 2-thiouridylase